MIEKQDKINEILYKINEARQKIVELEKSLKEVEKLKEVTFEEILIDYVNKTNCIISSVFLFNEVYANHTEYMREPNSKGKVISLTFNQDFFITISLVRKIVGYIVSTETGFDAIKHNNKTIYRKGEQILI